jgi:glycosyltransferase involved in cell wall biosynthesis
MNVLLLYHFFYPDTVVSARIMSDLAVELAQKGHSITVYTSNRLIRKDNKLCKQEEWNKVLIRRFSRTGFSQSNNIGRIINSISLQINWICHYFFERKKYDTIVVGTDPQFAWMIFPFIKLINRKVKLIHWCFDLFPEAIIANSSICVKALASLTKIYAFLCYRACDIIVDIGECMRKRLKKYNKNIDCCTLTPWALKEPDSIPKPDDKTREELFGKAKIGLLYSGTVGYAHNIKPFVELARECREKGIDAAFCFAGYGNCYHEQTSIITNEDTNIKLAGFASEEELEKRLAAADIHLVSLREGWEGIVVPSKFFGSLAMGRPVIFSGSEDSAIAQWCKEYSVGLLLDKNAVQFLTQTADNPSSIESLKENAFNTYHKFFSKDIVCNNWNELFL